MKLHLDCIPCLMKVAAEQAELATNDQELQFKALAEFSKFLKSNLSAEVVPPYLGTERSRIVRKVTSNPDPYVNLKKKSNEAGVELKSIAERLVNEAQDERKRLKRALKIAAVGNSMEFGVSGHAFDPASFRREFKELFERGLSVDDSDKVISKILSGEEILYLTDNCGEIILDQVLMREIREVGDTLSIGVKSSPVQEDVTLETAENLGIEKFGELIPTGSMVGVYPDEAPPEIRKKLEGAELILSKGMGNFETLSEFEESLRGRLAYLLRAKCNPVAESLGVERGSLVVKLVE